MSGKVGILIYIMIIIPHYYSPLSFCLATPFVSYCVFKESSVPTAVYNLHKVVPLTFIPLGLESWPLPTSYLCEDILFLGSL